MITVCYSENPRSLIIDDLLTQVACTVRESGQPGIVKLIDECPSYANKNITESDVGRVCDWTFCQSYVCCPKINVVDIPCVTHDDSKYNDILEVAGSCILKATNQKGTCMTRNKCVSIKYMSPEYQVCGRDCCSDFICCPDPDMTSLTTSERACADYRNTVYEGKRVITEFDPVSDKQRQCVAVSPSGGVLANPKEFPHFAVLGFEAIDKTVQWNCGGSLISDQYIITAGHCLNANGVGPVKYARLGIIDLNVNETDVRSDCPEEYEIIERIPHPEYKSIAKYHDIALLKLDRKVVFGPNVRPACLSDSRDFPEYKTLVATGFGLTGFLEQRTEQLIKVELSHFPHKECNASYASSINRRLKDGIVDEIQFCAGSRNSIQDTCPGDSGGPIEIKHQSYYKMSQVVGITSFGKACGFKNSPGVYTRIYPYLKWIEQIVWA